MELLVRFCRALANYRRLAIVRLLAIAGELAASVISKAIGASPAETSNELRILTANGVLWQRRSGRYVYYDISKSTVDRRHPIVSLLKGAFAKKPRGRLRLADLVRWRDAANGCPSDKQIYSCLTAFTHPRRLQILRHLTERGPATRLALSSALSMSEAASERQLDKLVRRGVVTRAPNGPEYVYSLRKSLDAEFDSRLLGCVLKWLEAGESDPTLVQV